MSLSPDQLRPQIISRWRRYLAAHSTADDPVFGLWGDLLRLPEEHFARSAVGRRQELAESRPGTAAGSLNPLIAPRLWPRQSSRARPTSRGCMATSSKRPTTELKHAGSAGTKSLDPARQQLLAILTTPEGPVWFPKSNAYLYMSRVERDKYHRHANGARSHRGQIGGGASAGHGPQRFGRRCAIRESSCGAIRPSRGNMSRGSSCGCWPAIINAPFRTAAAGSTWRGPSRRATIR